MDGYSLDVFVVEGWPYEVIKFIFYELQAFKESARIGIFSTGKEIHIFFMLWFQEKATHTKHSQNFNWP